MANATNSKVIFGNEVLIDLTQDTVAQSDVLSGKTFHDKSGATLTGNCSYDADTSDATATAGEILNTKTAYVNGSKVTGNMPNRGAVSGTISDVSTPYSIQNGYHDGSGTVAIDSTEAAKIIPGNIKDGVQMLGVTGTYTGEGATSEAISVTPYTTQKVYLPPTGKDFISQVTVAAISDQRVLDQTSGGYIVTIGAVDPNV